ncbi:hypothetical protein NGRA_2644 [Nosema granulosis]|uniref:Uncharacterized protein n=1 Tax=Nosema granulosis TaxID=83296 RepID=A0A9P6GX08_9MICR|nr:hypothetical protein NGRA_2644 [Nosema granulosis]
MIKWLFFLLIAISCFEESKSSTFEAILIASRYTRGVKWLPFKIIVQIYKWNKKVAKQKDSKRKVPLRIVETRETQKQTFSTVKFYNNRTYNFVDFKLQNGTLRMFIKIQKDIEDDTNKVYIYKCLYIPE